MMEKMMNLNIIDYYIINCAIPSIITIGNSYQICFCKPEYLFQSMFSHHVSSVKKIKLCQQACQSTVSKRFYNSAFHFDYKAISYSFIVSFSQKILKLIAFPIVCDKGVILENLTASFK